MSDNILLKLPYFRLPSKLNFVLFHKTKSNENLALIRIGKLIKTFGLTDLKRFKNTQKMYLGFPWVQRRLYRTRLRHFEPFNNTGRVCRISMDYNRRNYRLWKLDFVNYWRHLYHDRWPTRHSWENGKIANLKI